MPHLARWYERERWPYAADRQIVEEYATWVRTIPWKLFCTFTFASRVSDQQAEKVFAGYINQLEKFYRSDIVYVRGDEKRLSGCGKPASGRHFHALLASAAPLHPFSVESIWTEMAGKRADGANALAKPYDSTRNGASYILKMMNHPDGGWTLRKFHLFHPEAVLLNKRSRRYLRRHSDRVISFEAGNRTWLLHPDGADLDRGDRREALV
jgi:hypothetical protein